MLQRLPPICYNGFCFEVWHVYIQISWQTISFHRVQLLLGTMKLHNMGVTECARVGCNILQIHWAETATWFCWQIECTLPSMVYAETAIKLNFEEGVLSVGEFLFALGIVPFNKLPFAWSDGRNQLDDTLKTFHYSIFGNSRHLSLSHTQEGK